MKFEEYVFLLQKKSHDLKQTLTESLSQANKNQLIKGYLYPHDSSSAVIFTLPPVTDDTSDFRRDLRNIVINFSRKFVVPRTCWDNSKDWEIRQKECSYLAQLLIEAEYAQQDMQLMQEVQWILSNRDTCNGFFVGDTQVEYHQQLLRALSKCHQDSRRAQTTPMLDLRKQEEIIATAARFSQELKLVNVGEETYFLEEALTKHKDNPAQIAAITRAFAIAMINISSAQDRDLEAKCSDVARDAYRLKLEITMQQVVIARQREEIEALGQEKEISQAVIEKLTEENATLTKTVKTFQLQTQIQAGEIRELKRLMDGVLAREKQREQRADASVQEARCLMEQLKAKSKLLSDLQAQAKEESAGVNPRVYGASVPYSNHYKKTLDTGLTFHDRGFKQQPLRDEVMHEVDLNSPMTKNDRGYQ